MPYVQRDDAGRVVALFANSRSDASEFMHGRAPDVMRFLSEESSAEGQLHASDLEMGRVVEDLIYVLMERGVIDMESLPPPTQRKIRRREQVRSAIQKALSEQIFPGA